MRIDLTGSDGNAFALMGYVHSIGKQLELNKETRDAIVAEMQESDYNHLLDVFEKHFGHVAELIGRP